MSSEEQAAGLHILLIASLVASCLCFASALGMVGAKLVLRQYQKFAGINGTSKIQSTINLRTYYMRVFVGVTFGLFAALLWADAPMVARQWINRSLFVCVPLFYFIATLLDWWDERKQMRLEVDAANLASLARAEDRRVEEEERMASLLAANKSLQQMTLEAIEAMESVAEKHRIEKGLPKVEAIAPVVGEHHSPITPEQEQTAGLATLRARVTAAELGLGLPPREGGTHTSPSPEQELPPAEQTLIDMGEAAEETRVAAEETVTKAEVAIEAIKDQQEKLEENA